MVRIRGRREDTTPQHRRDVGSTVLNEYERRYLALRNAVEEAIPGVLRRAQRAGFDPCGEEHTLHCSDFLVRMTGHGPDFSKIPIKVEVGYTHYHIRD